MTTIPNSITPTTQSICDVPSPVVHSDVLQDRSHQTGGVNLEKLKPNHIAVSGGSITGCFAAMIAHSQGFTVDLYEKRPKPNREIQWSVRQAFLDTLAKVDSEGAELLYQSIMDPTNTLASLMPRGSIKTISINNQYFLPTRKKRMPPRQPDATRDCTNFLAQKPCFIVIAHQLEKFLRDRLGTFNGVTVLYENAELTEKPQRDRVVVNHRPYRLLVCAEGSRSLTFQDMRRFYPNLDRFVLSPERIQIGAVVKQQGSSFLGSGGGYTSKHYDLSLKQEHSPKINLTGITVEEQVSGDINAWVVQDLDFHPRTPAETELANEIHQFSTTGSKRFLSARARDYLKEYILSCAISNGAIEPISSEPIEIQLRNIKGEKISNEKEFILRHELINDAAPTPRVLFMGDMVGNAHWSVGGGMQIAAVAHGSRLTELLSNLNQGMSIDDCARSYSDGVISDTRSWLVSGYADTCLDASVYLEQYKENPEHPLNDLARGYELAVVETINQKDASIYQSFEKNRKQRLETISTMLDESLVPVSKEVYVNTLRSWVRQPLPLPKSPSEVMTEIEIFPGKDKEALEKAMLSLTQWVNEGEAVGEQYERQLFYDVYVSQLREKKTWPSIYMSNSLLSTLPDHLKFSKLFSSASEKTSWPSASDIFDVLFSL